MMRSYSVRVDVLRHGATLTTLHPVSDPSVDCESSGAIKSSMSGIFLDDPAVKWLTDELQPIQIIDGIEYPVGIFPIGTVARSTDENGLHTVRVEAYDRCMILNQAKTETILHLSKGSNYIQVVEQLLTKAGIALYLTTKCQEVLATDREDWRVGTPFLTIINTLLQEINYDPIWFDANGMAIVRPAKKPAASNIDHAYGGTDDGLCVLERPNTVETDAFDTPNVFVAICNNPDLPAPLTATAVNDNPLSALSVLRRGRRIPTVLSVDNIPNQQALEDYAQRKCADSMLASETVTISTANVPGHGVLDTVALIHPDAEGIYQETGWSLILAPGQTMIHHLRRSILI